MTRSPMLDVLLASAFLVGATAMMGLLSGAPGRCPTPAPSSIEGLFAPCLVADRRELGPPPTDLPLSLPPPPIERGGTAIATSPPRLQLDRDVEVTGSVTQPRQ